LDELCTVCKFNRKYAIRVLGKKQSRQNKKKGRPKIYHHQAIIEFLKDLWVVTNLACAERLKAAIPLRPPYYQFHKKNSLNEKEVKLLLEISASTIKRLLRRLRSKHRKFGLSTTKPGSLIKKQVPIKLNQWDESVEGFIVIAAGIFKNKIWKIFWYLIAVITSIGRIYHDQHWFSDVIAAAEISIYIGIHINKIHQSKDCKTYKKREIILK
ncbi:MAG: phosphatase PAP2 family protein, partial [Ignavibacteriaceae bacterium]